jgi:hypothetical protein
MPDNPTNDTEAPERELPDESKQTDEDSRSNSGNEGFRTSRTDTDNQSLEELSDDE